VCAADLAGQTENAVKITALFTEPGKHPESKIVGCGARVRQHGAHIPHARHLPMTIAAPPGRAD
jgi:hypothetical protein